MIPFRLILCGLGLWLTACGGSSGAARGDADGDPGGVPSSDSRDPCTLISRAEMERLVGPLGEPPYRAGADRQADPAGDQCVYRDRDLRPVAIEVDWDGGPLLMQLLGGTALAAEDMLGTRDLGADTLWGSWDQIQVSFGRMVALKDSTAVTVDALGARLNQAAQAGLAAVALSRIGSPLAYDGSRAARSRPAAPGAGNPCSLVTRAEAESLMGPLRNEPTPSEDGTQCTFVLREELFGSPVEQSLTVQWADGFHALGEERLATGMAATMMAQEMGEIPRLATDGSGPGEPWNEVQVLLGGRVTVVGRDLLLQAVATGVGGFDEDRALQLLRIAMRRALAR